MIGTITSLLLSRYGKIVVIVVLFVAVVFYIDRRGFNRGVMQTTDRYETAIEEERQRQQEIFRMTIEDRNQREAELRRQLEEREDEIIRLSEEAAADPNANRNAIGADSVRRLNQIQ